MLKKNNMMPIIIVIGAMIILNVLDGRFSNIGSWIYQQILMLPAIVIGLSFHEFGHAIVSDRLGDPTPKNQGRVTLNPLAHIDPIGFFCLFFAGFGWGRPVMINPDYYKHPRRDELLVSLAGVVMNLLTAILGAFVLRLLYHSSTAFVLSTTGGIVADIFKYIVMINLVLMIFNLIPVPPLDGFGILTQLFNLRKYHWYMPVYQYGELILLALILFNVTSFLIGRPVDALWSLLANTIIV